MAQSQKVIDLVNSDNDQPIRPVGIESGFSRALYLILSLIYPPRQTDICGKKVQIECDTRGSVEAKFIIWRTFAIYSLFSLGVDVCYAIRFYESLSLL